MQSSEVVECAVACKAIYDVRDKDKLNSWWTSVDFVITERDGRYILKNISILGFVICAVGLSVSISVALNVTELTPQYPKYEWVSGLGKGSIYLDKNSRIQSLPKEMQGIRFMKTIRGDRKQKCSDFKVSFNASADFTLYSHFRGKTSTSKGPSWMGSPFAKSKESIWDVNIYKKDYKAGKIDLCGGADRTMWAVGVKPKDGQSIELSEPVVKRIPWKLGKAQKGSQIWSDVPGSKFNSLPSELSGGVLVQTANGDRRHRLDAVYSIKVDRPVTLFTLHGNKATTGKKYKRPKWIGNPTGAEIKVKVGGCCIAGGVMQVYSKPYPAGKISLKGMNRDGGDGEGNMIVFIIKANDSTTRVSMPGIANRESMLVKLFDILGRKDSFGNGQRIHIQH